MALQMVDRLLPSHSLLYSHGGRLGCQHREVRSRPDGRAIPPLTVLGEVGRQKGPREIK